MCFGVEMEGDGVAGMGFECYGDGDGRVHRGHSRTCAPYMVWSSGEGTLIQCWLPSSRQNQSEKCYREPIRTWLFSNLHLNMVPLDQSEDALFNPLSACGHTQSKDTVPDPSFKRHRKPKEAFFFF